MKKTSRPAGRKQKSATATKRAVVLLSKKLSARAAARPALRRVGIEELTLRRVKRGEKFSYRSETGKPIRDPRVVRRLSSLAVPPAYREVCYAADPAAHIQAIGRDAAGRLQYRYHPDWVKVREARKARHLARLIAALPRIRRGVSQHLSTEEPNREFALAAAIELVASTSIRAGSEGYARERGTRGAATLLKSNVTINGSALVLSFRAKGGKKFHREVKVGRLAAALSKLAALPGRRLFLYRGEDGGLHRISAQEINVFLRDLAGANVSLKDFRNLCASATVLDILAQETPASSERGRRRQVRNAVETAARALDNTPAICRKSYVHDGVVAAFENGGLTEFADVLKGSRSTKRSEQFLTQVIAEAHE